MSSAGQQLIAGRIPGERIATTEETTDSATFTTTETVVMTVTAPLVIGRTYQIRFVGHFVSTVAGDFIVVTLREDGLAGSIRQQQIIEIPGTAAAGFPAPPTEAEYTATGSADKTFVVTADRLSGSGTYHLEAASSRPCFLAVNYIRG